MRGRRLLTNWDFRQQIVAPYVGHRRWWHQIPRNNGGGQTKARWSHGSAARSARPHLTLPNMLGESNRMSGPLWSSGASQARLSCRLHDTDRQSAQVRLFLLLQASSRSSELPDAAGLCLKHGKWSMWSTEFSFIFLGSIYFVASRRNEPNEKVISFGENKLLKSYQKRVF